MCFPNAPGNMAGGEQPHGGAFSRFDDQDQRDAAQLAHFNAFLDANGYRMATDEDKRSPGYGYSEIPSIFNRDYDPDDRSNPMLFNLATGEYMPWSKTGYTIDDVIAFDPSAPPPAQPVNPYDDPTTFLRGGGAGTTSDTEAPSDLAGVFQPVTAPDPGDQGAGLPGGRARIFSGRGQGGARRAPFQGGGSGRTVG